LYAKPKIRLSPRSSVDFRISNLLYFDHNATTPIAPEVAEVMLYALRDIYGNPSSTHQCGQSARQELERSRRAIAAFINASPTEFVFTSGGTEANNLALLGFVRSLPAGRKHLITTAIEHPSVLEPCRHLEREGTEVTIVGVDAQGLIDPDAVRASLRPETVLISVMHANNEVGAIQPVRAIAGIVQEQRAAGQTLFLHSDGVQAMGKISVDVQALGVDLYSMSAHKVFAPKGIGGLFVRKGTPLEAVQYGGRHERNRRAGTENVPGAMAFARAVELCNPAAAQRLAELRDQFEAEALSSFEGTTLNGAKDCRLPNTSNLFFPEVSAEALVIALDLKGMAVSTGSACSSGSVEPSHVLLAMGRTRQEARSSVRFSFSRYNTAQEVDSLLSALSGSLANLRNRRAEDRVAV
jgi:cysteine desulfurase